MDTIKIIFFDKDYNKINKYKNVLSHIPNFEFIHSDFDQIMLNKNINAIVSPANSYGYMNGGIDSNINMFLNNIQPIVQNQISKYGFLDQAGRNYLPVGKCIVVKSTNNFYLFVTPTMQTPKKILPGENNVSIAFFALLQIISQWNTKYPLIIACPCLGTGVGMLDPELSAQQILQAYNFFKTI
jgi:O-acetyl-ADP-ribose deacetylase (regulator of RNase III)